MSQVLKAFLKQTDTRRMLTKNLVFICLKYVLASAKSQSINMQRIKKKRVLASYKYFFNYNHLAVEHHWPNFMSICQLVMAVVLSGEENRRFAHWADQKWPTTNHSKWHSLEGKNNQNKCSRKPKKSYPAQCTQNSGRLRGTKRLQVWSATTPSPLGSYPSDSNFIISPKKLFLSHPELKLLWTWHHTSHYTRTTKVLLQFSFNCHGNSVYLDLSIILGCS